MNIIMLSGGSGKRLWPLSNEARSKQFLHLLDDGNGKLESMVQRVVRQIRQSGLEADVTFATNSTQKDIIINQLGEGIGIVSEPERRDTFPAIALSCAYLAFEKGLGEDEVVVIMPCDPYTENGYFKVLGKIAEAVGKDLAEMVLMGIKPDCPSSKFGYIVPGEQLGEAFAVKRFTEKPNRDEARRLLQQGALWNGGVFAFRLGYMMNIVRKYVDASSFDEVLARYTEFPKISFDYEVAEKAADVAVIPFDGSWKDLGTWNSLSDELKSPVVGNALVGPDCENVHVVSELGRPIFVNGVRDVVVAASPDGILVCGKQYTESIKEYVGSIGSRPCFEERRWGTYRVIDSNEYEDGFKTLTKSITLSAGKNISYQIHRHRSEVWTFVDGEGLLILDGKVSKVGRGSVAQIPAGCKHSVKALTDLTFIEVQSGDLLVEEDIERLSLTWPE